MNTQIENLNDTIDLWEKVSSIADFNSKTNPYDEALLDEIKKELGFEAECDVHNELVSHKTSPEQLLAVLLKVMKPFSIMLNDLLKMFEDARAQYSDNNFMIKFDFDKAKETFDLDLENFRLCTKMVNNVVYHEFRLESSSPLTDFVYPLGEILADKHLFPDKCNNPSFPDEINEWLKEYDDCARNDKNWPETFPNPPKSGVERIDNIIAEIWQLPKAACKLYNGCFLSNLKRKESLTKKQELLIDSRKKSLIENELFPPDCRFYSHEAESWIGIFVKILVCLVENIKIKNNDDLNIDVIVDRLEEFRKSLPIESFVRERLVETLENILILPLWKKRYTLYSAWVATQIVTASEEWKPVYNVNKGVLSFSFGGSVIAHLKYNTFDIELHAELNTWYDPKEMVGSERIDHIQPDYSLCINEKSDPKNTILVVECKQYKVPDKKKFQAAVIDYAGGRPNAQVILVNYTKINDTFKSDLKLTDKGKKAYDRNPYFNILFPGDVESCNSFMEAVRYSILNECSITLAWDESPKDLDLILEMIDSEGKKIRIYYDNKGNTEQYPFAHLDRDDQNGNGCETINALILPSRKYNVLVHNYKEEATNGEISVSIKLGEDEMIVKTTRNLDTKEEWLVFTIENCSIQEKDVMIPIN